MLNQQIHTNIIPSRQTFVKCYGTHQLDKQAICAFVATGFFMDDDTYWTDEKCLLPGTVHTLDASGNLLQSQPWFQWHYTPRDITFETALEEYIALLTDITASQVGSQKVILPLSGGLDSRSQALILKSIGANVQSYSYEFARGYQETKIAAQIAKACHFDFKAFVIPHGYLWSCLDEMAQINGCYSEFTHPRQMAILPQLKQMEGVFSLGHWGDVLFDRGAPEGSKNSDMVPLLLKKMLKPGGHYLAGQLWKAWDLKGSFHDYFISRIEASLNRLKIDHVSAKLRAFKSSQWAHRWTTTNLSIFEAAHPISLPYYDDRMCEFICTVPEAYLADRRLQIAHLKQDKALSKITWQAQKPFNLNNYHYNKAPFNVPYRLLLKLDLKRKSIIGHPLVQRNYELQFLGASNDHHLRQRVFDASINDLVPKGIVDDIYKKFTSENTVLYSHPMSMLLTLAVWKKRYDRVR